MKYRKSLIITALVSAGLIGGPAALLQAQVPTPGWVPQQQQTYPQGQLGAGQPVNFSQLPPQVQATIRNQAGGTAVTSVNRQEMSTMAYQAPIYSGGRTIQMQFTPDGRALNRPDQRPTVALKGASPIAFNQLPLPVQNSIRQYSGGGSVGTVYQGTLNEPYYQAYLQNGQQILVAQNGNLFQSGTINEAAGAAPYPSYPQTGTYPQTGAGTGASVQFKDLPWTVQKPMLDQSGWASIPQVTETRLPDGRTAYSGTYQKDNRSYQITVDQNGNVISNQAIQ